MYCGRLDYVVVWFIELGYAVVCCGVSMLGEFMLYLCCSVSVLCSVMLCLCHDVSMLDEFIMWYVVTFMLG